jgi:hypothetical protein
VNRRKFIQGVFAGIATVAIASKLAPQFPRLGTKTFSLGYTITKEEIEPGLYGDISERYAKALAKSMMETYETFEVRAANIFAESF